MQVKLLESMASVLDIVVEDGETLLHTNGVLYKPEIIEGLRAMEVINVVEVKLYSRYYAFGVTKADGNTTFISSKWVSLLSDNGIDIKPSKFVVEPTNRGVYISPKFGYLLHTTNCTLHRKEDIKSCSCCSVEVEDNTLEGLCNSCYTGKYFVIKPYSYKPAPKFIGEQHKGDIETPIWYGLELEYGIHSKISVVKALRGKAVYFKSDVSIHTGHEGGVEVVTHPHSFNCLMGEDSFINKLPEIDCNRSTSNGCHIHVGRTAWATDKHYALTYYLMYEMGMNEGTGLSMLEQIGGREFTSYCRRDKPEFKIYQLKKDGAKNTPNRAVWLNERNEATIEFRFFMGSNKPEEVKRYVQLLDSVIKYTKYNDKRVSVTGWRSYVKKYRAKYSELDSFLEGLTTIVHSTVVYREPIRKNVPFSKVKIVDIPNIVKVVKVDGKSFIVGRRGGRLTDRGVYAFRNRGENNEEIKIQDIAYVVIEE